MTLSKGSRAAIAVAALLTTVTLNRLFLLQSRSERANDTLVATAEVLYVPDIRMMRLVFLGYDQAAADVIWVRTLEYFANHFEGDRQYQWLEYFLDQIIALDPAFQKVYHWAGTNVLYGRRFTNENVMLSNRFYEMALENDPSDFEAAYRLGINYFIELKSPDEEERKRWQEKGLAYLELAAANRGAPDRLKQLVAGISTSLGKQQLALQYLVDLYLTATDPQLKETWRQRIAVMRAELGEDATTAAADRFEAGWKATVPYVSPAMFALMGEPASRQIQDVDWHTLINGPETEGDAPSSDAPGSDTPTSDTPGDTP